MVLDKSPLVRACKTSMALFTDPKTLARIPEVKAITRKITIVMIM
jgi:hypothetical protein